MYILFVAITGAIRRAGFQWTLRYYFKPHSGVSNSYRFYPWTRKKSWCQAAIAPLHVPPPSHDETQL